MGSVSEIETAVVIPTTPNEDDTATTHTMSADTATIDRLAIAPGRLLRRRGRTVGIGVSGTASGGMIDTGMEIEMMIRGLVVTETDVIPIPVDTGTGSAIIVEIVIVTALPDAAHPRPTTAPTETEAATTTATTHHQRHRVRHRQRTNHPKKK